MTQNEVSIIKNSVIDATEAYVEARLSVLDFVKTQIGVVLSYTRKADKKYYHTVRCNATSRTSGIVYENVLSVGNIPLPVGSVVFLIAPNAQYSNQFILGKLDTTPAHIEGGSIRLGGTDENDAPIYLTSEPYTYGGKQVYGHIGSFYITTNGLRITGNNSDISEITGKQVRLSEWKELSSTSGVGLSMMMDIDKSYIAINTNGYNGGSSSHPCSGFVVSNAYGWDSNGNFTDPLSNSTYTRVHSGGIEIHSNDFGSKYITPQGAKFLSDNQDHLAYLVVAVGNYGIKFEWDDPNSGAKMVTIPWGWTP